MNPITVTEFNLTHSTKGISEERFEILALRALDLTEELCFGRAARNEKEARRAMKEMISFWIEENGESDRGITVEREAVGNYSVTQNIPKAPSVHGIALSPAALLILQRAGLRDHGV